MTGLLTDLMHDRADRLEAPELDLTRITRDGARVVRRRRTAVVGGVAAASVVAVMTGAALFGGGGGGSDDAVADRTVPDLPALSWVTGRTLHTGVDSSVELAADVRAYVLVGGSIVYTDPDGAVHLRQGDGETVIGSAVTPEYDLAELVTDGTFVAWVDGAGRVVRYDVSDGTEVRAPRLPGRGARVTAVDGALVYVADSAGVYSWQPTAPDGYTTLDTDARAVVLDAEDGVLVRNRPGSTVVFERDGATIDVAAREFADLSPDGRLLSIEDKDVGEVIDTTTGDEVTLDHGHEWAVGYQWLSPTTLAVLAFDGVDGDEASMDGWLLTCDALSGDCEQIEHLPRLGGFQLPVGATFSS